MAIPLPIRVMNPHHWWLAHREELPWLQDPDEVDGRQRHPDRDERDWSLIARTAAAAGKALQTATVRQDGGATYASVPPPSAAVVGEDLDIVTSWFNYSAPTGDPWRTDLVDGRHRLWFSWLHEPDLLLPIRSSHLGYVLEFAEDPTHLDRLAEEADTGLTTIAATAVMKRNLSFLSALEAVRP